MNIFKIIFLCLSALIFMQLYFLCTLIDLIIRPFISNNKNHESVISNK